MKRAILYLAATLLSVNSYASSQSENESWQATFKLGTGAVIERSASLIAFTHEELVLKAFKAEPVVAEDGELTEVVNASEQLVFPKENPFDGTNPVEDVALTFSMTKENFIEGVRKLVNSEDKIEITFGNVTAVVNENEQGVADEANSNVVSDDGDNVVAKVAEDALVAEGEVVVAKKVDDDSKDVAFVDAEAHFVESNIVYEDDKPKKASRNCCFRTFDLLAKILNWNQRKIKDE